MSLQQIKALFFLENETALKLFCSSCIFAHRKPNVLSGNQSKELGMRLLCRFFSGGQLLLKSLLSSLFWAQFVLYPIGAWLVAIEFAQGLLCLAPRCACLV